MRDILRGIVQEAQALINIILVMLEYTSPYSLILVRSRVITGAQATAPAAHFFFFEKSF